MSSLVDRARWDRDVTRFNEDLRALERFFLDVIAKRLASDDTVSAVWFPFLGVQGPRYTVGWKMAVTRSHPDTLARWSPALLRAIAGR